MEEQQAAGPEVLVAFATRHGSTAGVAERIAARLRDAGVRASVASAETAGAAAGYDAVVLGSGVYNQRWLPGAETFLRDNLVALGRRPVWLFSVGTFGDRKPIIGPLMRREPRDIEAMKASIGPRDYRVFAGVIERRHWPPLARLLYHALGGRLGDNRDWQDIDDWARAIAAALRAPAQRQVGDP